MLEKIPFISHRHVHQWRFFRAGGFDQVRLDTADDLIYLDQLDQKLWVALACPTTGLEFDEKTLEKIDTDKDGRIRAPDIIAAVKWAMEMLKDHSELLKMTPELALEDINDATPEGKQLVSSARQVLYNLGKPDALKISVEDTTDIAKILAQSKLNGDGVVPADAAAEPALHALIEQIMLLLGSTPDRSGKPGIDAPKVEQFFTDLQMYSDWQAHLQTDAATLLPLGPATHSAFAALQAVRAKIDDYFIRCQLAAFDNSAMLVINRQQSDYLAISTKDLSISSVELASFPLALVSTAHALPLSGAVNPAWAAALERFANEVAGPVLGNREQLSLADWNKILARFTPYQTWQSNKAGEAVESLGLERIRELLAGNARQQLNDLIAKDVALAGEFDAFANLDKLVRYHRDLYKLLLNFVNFKEFYSRKGKAIFQVGTLFLDQRSCELCIRVTDMARHGLMVHLSQTYVAYCECTRKATNETMTIVAAFTGGDSDNLMVGRNGVFYDRKGNDWDATIVKIVENPISIRQAFWSPYKRLIRWIENQIAKRAAAADAAADAQLTAVTNSVIAVPTANAPQNQRSKIDIGTVAAIGVAFGSITAAMGMLLQAFFGLGGWMPLGVLALICLISGPSMIIAWLKLTQRNLGPILDANGWAINSKARVNIAFGTALTGVAALPLNAHRDLLDPYADSKAERYKFIALVILVCVIGFVVAVGPTSLITDARIIKTQFMEFFWPESVIHKNNNHPATQSTDHSATPSMHAPVTTP